MGKLIALLAVVSLISLGGCFPSYNEHSHRTDTAEAGGGYDCCDVAKKNDAWCSECQRGFIKGETVMCKDCHTSLKATGKPCAKHIEK